MSIFQPFAFFAPVAGAGPAYLLDTYPGATVAHSVRRLSSTYTGDCVRVRRNYDSGETNIGFDGNGYIDLAALSTFVVGGSATVTTWFDQSGNGNDAIMAITSKQPMISDGSGNPYLAPSKASLNFATSRVLTYYLPYLVYGASSSFYFITTRAVGSNKYLFGGSGPGSKPTFLTGYEGDFEWYDADRIVIQSTGASQTNVSQVSATVTEGVNVTAYYQGAQKFSQAAGTLGTTRNLEVIGGSATTSDLFNGKMSEVVLYMTTNESSNTAGILANQNAFYVTY
jgi:hypothetical protein